MTLDGEEMPLLYSDIHLSNNPDFWVFTDLANYQGRKLTVTGKIQKYRLRELAAEEFGRQADAAEETA